MPSPYSSTGTRGDAHTARREPRRRAARAADRRRRWRAYDELLADVFAGREPDLTEENLQARIRGNLLMALSNKFGWLVLTTGNKSEMSVGYSTLYGDSAGGFAVIKDVPQAARLPARRGARRSATAAVSVPEPIVTRPPSAELRPDQRDEDSLPPYEVLDAILEGYVEEDLGREQLVARGLPAERRRPRHPPRRPRRVQAPPAAARHQDHDQGVRPRPAHADHQPLRRLSVAPPQIGRTAIVIRTSAHRRPSSSVMSTSQIQVVRPRWRRRARAWIVPSVIGRRNDVWLDRPMAALPSGRRRRAVAIDAIDSAIDAKHAAVHQPGGWLELVADRHPGAHELVAALEDLESVEGVEARPECASKDLIAHRERRTLRGRLRIRASGVA